MYFLKLPRNGKRGNLYSPREREKLEVHENIDNCWYEKHRLINERPTEVLHHSKEITAHAIVARYLETAIAVDPKKASMRNRAREIPRRSV